METAPMIDFPPRLSNRTEYVTQTSPRKVTASPDSFATWTRDHQSPSIPGKCVNTPVFPPWYPSHPLSRHRHSDGVMGTAVGRQDAGTVTTLGKGIQARGHIPRLLTKAIRGESIPCVSSPN